MRRRRGRTGRALDPESAVALGDLAAPDRGTQLRAAQAFQGQLGNAVLGRLVAGQTVQPTPTERRRGLSDDAEELVSDVGNAVSDVAESVVSGVEATVEAVEQGVEEVIDDVTAALAQTNQLTTQGATPLAGGSGGSAGTTFTRSDVEEKRDDATLNDVATALSNRGEAGSTQPSFGTISTTLDGGGKVTAATVTVTETVTMPTWTKADKQCEPIKKEWTRFRAALAVHEQGHVDIDKKWFGNLDQRLVGVKDDAVDTKVEQIKAQADKENNEYDTKTDHGLKQGTGIDAGIRCSDKV
jgi:hypothetical protein